MIKKIIVKDAIIMKKIAVLTLTLILLLGAVVGTFSVSAATHTKQDIVDKVSESAIYKYISSDVKNLVRNVDPTDEQLDKLYSIAERFVALGLTDKGASADKYTSEEVQSVLALIDEGCKVMNYTYTFTPAANATHKGDVDLKIYDASNKQIYSYDGDVIKKTGADQTALFVTLALCGVALLAGAVVVKTKKSVEA